MPPSMGLPYRCDTSRFLSQFPTSMFTTWKFASRKGRTDWSSYRELRQDDAVEAPVGAKVEQDELAVGLSLGQCRLNVLVGVRALVVRALRARRGVRAKGECQEGGQREPLHTGLHGPTGIWEVYTARASRVRVLLSRARGPSG